MTMLHMTSSWNTHHFLPNKQNVDAPTGVAARGPAISHTVNVIWALCGRSQKRIGRVIHSFQLGNDFKYAVDKGITLNVRISVLEGLEGGTNRYGEWLVVGDDLTRYVEVG